MKPLPRRHETNPLRDPIVLCALIIAFVMAVGACVACSTATLNRIDPLAPTPCAGGPCTIGRAEPRFLRDAGL